MKRRKVQSTNEERSRCIHSASAARIDECQTHLGLRETCVLEHRLHACKSARNWKKKNASHENGQRFSRTRAFASLPSLDCKTIKLKRAPTVPIDRSTETMQPLISRAAATSQRSSSSPSPWDALQLLVSRFCCRSGGFLLRRLFSRKLSKCKASPHRSRTHTTHVTHHTTPCLSSTTSTTRATSTPSASSAPACQPASGRDRQRTDCKTRLCFVPLFVSRHQNAKTCNDCINKQHIVRVQRGGAPWPRSDSEHPREPVVPLRHRRARAHDRGVRRAGGGLQCRDILLLFVCT
jgi:hypothetical protein